MENKLAGKNYLLKKLLFFFLKKKNEKMSLYLMYNVTIILKRQTRIANEIKKVNAL